MLGVRDARRAADRSRLPPRRAKAQRVTKVGSLWALTRNPETRLGIASYAQSLAEGFGREVRNWITTFNGDEDTLDLGLRIAPRLRVGEPLAARRAPRRRRLRRHRLRPHRPAARRHLSSTTRSPTPSRPEAPYYRDRVWDWWQSVGCTPARPRRARPS